MISINLTGALLCLILFCVSVLSNEEELDFSKSASYGEPFNLTAYVAGHGYPIEVHPDLQTEDGYLLTLHRIPSGKNNTETTSRPVAFLMHGLGGTASNWVDGGPEYSLAFLLADRGYDVWLGNARGTTHSKKHIALDPEKDEAEFWDFSWHEIGYYDLPTNFDHIFKVTKQKQLFYVGHSQGCTAYFVLMSTRPEMNERVKLFSALAPAVYGIGDVIKIPKNLAYTLFRQIDYSRKLFGIYTDPFGPRMEQFACKSIFSNKFLCDLFINMRSRSFGFDPNKMTPEHWEIIKQTVPDSSSMKQNMHYIQVGFTDEFRQYDLGTEENKKKYGEELPPFYDLSKVTSHVAIFYGEKDNQVTPSIAERVAKMLPNVVSKNEIEGFTHVDFLAANAAVELVYKEIFALMFNYA